MQPLQERKPAAGTAGLRVEERGTQPAFWVAIVSQVAQSARACSKLDPKRVDRAVGLLLAPNRSGRGPRWHWDPMDIESMYIRGSRGNYYRVNGDCECRDAQRHGAGWWCKHRLARAIIVRALDIDEKLSQQHGPLWWSDPGTAKDRVADALNGDKSEPPHPSPIIEAGGLSVTESRAHDRDTALPVDRGRITMFKAG